MTTDQPTPDVIAVRDPHRNAADAFAALDLTADVLRRLVSDVRRLTTERDDALKLAEHRLTLHREATAHRDQIITERDTLVARHVIAEREARERELVLHGVRVELDQVTTERDTERKAAIDARTERERIRLTLAGYRDTIALTRADLDDARAALREILNDHPGHTTIPPWAKAVARRALEED
jgi:hypothetical protein